MPAPKHLASRPRSRTILLVIGVIALAPVAWRKGIRDHLQPDNFGVVRPGVLYRSADLTPAATRLVHDRYGIRTIIDLGAFQPGSASERTAQRTADALGISRRVFRLEGDGTGDPNSYVEALRVMTDPSMQPVLVHCAAGAERTGGCVAFYRQFMQGVSFDDAYAEARLFKHSPRRNPNLEPYLRQWAGPIGHALATGTPVAGFAPAPPPTPPTVVDAGKAPDAEGGTR